MTTADNHDREYIMIWVWLVALLVTGTLIFMLPISKTAAIALIFGIAAVKAILVLRDYMHLKSERMLVYA
ncbi:MAG TPA: cytochrome C oxidase subunit IV family protein, partial [Candidatus Binataceae bacterium]|nr:cytochrome C oxidase subunit IV family protein [Candidatus Binataceae bacterium]